MIVLDAAAIIALLNPHDLHHAETIRLLRETEAEPRTASPINLAEAMVGPTRIQQTHAAVAAITAWRIGETPLPDDAALRLASLRASTARRMPDCCALLAAQQTGGILLTFDSDLARSAPKVGVSVLG